MKTDKKEIVRKSELLAQIRADLKAWGGGGTRL